MARTWLLFIRFSYFVQNSRRTHRQTLFRNIQTFKARKGYRLKKMDSTESAKIVVLGSCSVDFTTYSPRLPLPGETAYGTKFTTSFGGKGANQCVAIAKLGGKVCMICRVGCDQWGDNYRSHFKDLAIDTRYVYPTPGVTTGIAQINVTEDGQNQIIIVSGANSKLCTSDVRTAQDVIESADILIGQLETPLETMIEAFKLNKGIKLLNAAPARSDIEAILPLCSILCVNETEASIITGTSVDSDVNIRSALLKMKEMGCKTVIITLGGNGAVYITHNEEQVVHVKCDQVTPVDTTGAGDAFIGALALYLTTYKDKPLHQIIGAACEVATISVTKEGTQTSFPTDYKPFTKEYTFANL